MEEKMNGTVKWFNTSKGFGFILGEDGKEVFVHYSDILTDGFKNLAEGEAVSFKTVDNGKGLRAVEVEKAGQ